MKLFLALLTVTVFSSVSDAKISTSISGEQAVLFVLDPDNTKVQNELSKLDPSYRLVQIALEEVKNKDVKKYRHIVYLTHKPEGTGAPCTLRAELGLVTKKQGNITYSEPKLVSVKGFCAVNAQ